MKEIMKYKIHRNKSDFNPMLNKKSRYLINLKKRRDNSLLTLQKQKQSFIEDKLLKKNEFDRDYSFFNCLPGYIEGIVPIKLHFTPDMKFYFQSPIEKIYPNRYKNQNKKLYADSFSVIYKDSNSNYPTRDPPFQIKLLKKNNPKFLCNIGNEVVFTNNKNSDS